MRSSKSIMPLLVLLTINHFLHASLPNLMQLPQETLEKIGHKIWKNECKKSIEKLTWWNQGEAFASLGIGHFIWYPQGITKTYTETFPNLLQFLVQHGQKLPSWLVDASPEKYCPWKNREEFFKDIKSPRMKELRALLSSTIHLQTKFIMQRVNKALQSMLNAVEPEQRPHIENQFSRLASHEDGLFAIIDYINFKGEGTNSKERYNGLGWGLLHILQTMNGKEYGAHAVKEFSHHAKKILTERVLNAPKEKDEKKFLNGWHKRIDTYIQTYC